ncbi:MAG TPA: hypothetical protein DHW82_03890 [Spirochaetia bacterium]|nr:MAG: hypothetical protein A2Y41_08975 [Spirochaetes bacterium GWB1_36_13]HCL56135.1 hypothetical protein [Spirochaetia bacterium]
MNLLIIKILVSIFMVIFLAEIAKRVNPVLGGILSGLPLGTGLSVYFISYEQGIDFFIPAIPWGIAALASSLLFCFVYFKAGQFFSAGRKLLGMFGCSLLGFLVFFLSGFGLEQIKINFSLSLLIFFIFFLGNLFYMRKVKSRITIVRQESKKLTSYQLLIRGLLVGLIIVGITGLGVFFGEKWAAILSSFPSTLYVLLLILHFDGNDRYYPAVIYGFSHSVSTLAVFYLSSAFFLPRFGLNKGFILSYAFSIFYIYFYNKIIIKRLK